MIPLPQSGLLRFIALFSLILALGLGFAWVWLKPGNLAPPVIESRFSLIDQNNRPRTEKDFTGKFQLVFFGYTHCPGPCPTALNNMALALDRLTPAARAEIVPLFITLDPERDNPAILKDYLANFGADFVGLTGSEAAIAAAEDSYRIYAKKLPSEDPADYYFDHTILIYLMDREGNYLTHFSGDAKPEAIATGLKSAIARP